MADELQLDYDPIEDRIVLSMRRDGVAIECLALTRRVVADFSPGATALRRGFFASLGRVRRGWPSPAAGNRIEPTSTGIAFLRRRASPVVGRG